MREHTPWPEIWHAIAHEHRRRSVLGLVLMASQAFFLLGAALMIGAAVVEAVLGVKAERQPLEAIANPLSAK